jgi:chemotaxis protein MotB
MAGKKADRKGSVIIKRNEIVEGGHHGGAWKVAYADFVTAMMAFFLLMWLLNATTEDQRKGLADYFSPSNLMSHNSSGTGQPFGGHTAFDDGALVSDRGAEQITVGKRPVITNTAEGDAEVFTDAQGYRPEVASTRQGGNSDDELAANGDRTGRAPATEAEIRAEKERQEKDMLEKAAEQIRQAVRDDPTLAEIARQLSIDMTPEGLRIQIMDEVKLPMFATGSSTPNDRARALLQKVIPVLGRLPEAISIAGHTDAAPFPGPDRTNWELSTERANATRRLLVDGGLKESRIRTVTGHADKDPLLPAEPLAAANRRIAIVVLRDSSH